MYCGGKLHYQRCTEGFWSIYFSLSRVKVLTMGNGGVNKQPFVVAGCGGGPKRPGGSDGQLKNPPGGRGCVVAATSRSDSVAERSMALVTTES